MMAFVRTSAHCADTISGFRGTRSATIPLTGVRTSIGIPKPKKISPSATVLSVMSKVRNPRATMAVQSAAKLASVAHHNTR